MSRRNWYLATNSVVLAWLVATAVAVFVHRAVDQPIWLMVHVPLLGAATAAIIIWSQHFADTLLRRQAPLGRPGLAARLTAHTVGAALIIAGMLANVLELVVVGAGLVAAAILTHAVVLIVQRRGALPARFAPLVRYSIAAALVFMVGIGIGIHLAVAGSGAAGAERFIVAHLILNGYGWIGLTALGTLVLLWPTVLHARMPETADRTARLALPVLVGGLLIAAGAAVANLMPGVAVGLLIWLVGAGMLAREGWREARAMPPGTFTGWSLGAAFGWLAIAAAWIGVLALTSTDWASMLDATMVVLGPLVAGFVVQLLTGALSYLLPVVALGSPAAAKAGAEELDRAAVFRVVAFNGAIVLYLLPVPSVAKVVLSMLALGIVIAFLVLAIRAIVVGRRVRIAEGSEVDRSGRVLLGAPQMAPAPPRNRAGALAAAVTALVLSVTIGVAADPASVGISTVAVGKVVATGNTTEVVVRVDGMRYDPAVIEVPAGDELVVTFENTGTDVHDLTFANGVSTARLAPGERETIVVGLIGGDFAGWCSIAGHRQMGMELEVIALGAAPIAEDAESGTHGEHGEAVSTESAADLVDLHREPTAGFEAWPAALAPAPSTTVHRITLEAQEILAEVAPGVTQTRWTFNGTAPGPVLRGRVGDTFEITLINDGSLGHSIDFHAGALAPNEPMRTIMPGESLTYTFTAGRAGIWMYHCSTMPMSMHIANGMFGAVIIDPPDLPAVDREYLLVQGELYLGEVGGTADAAKIAAIAPDLVTFNGYADQYRYRPLQAAVGERVRVWVLAAGPNLESSFHVVGGQFDTVYREGAYDLLPGIGGSQTLGLFAAQGGFVELEFPEAGDYPFVTHRMTDAERGAGGLFHVEG